MTTYIFTFFILAFLEILLSGDNAIVLASLAKRLEKPEKQQSALNIGMIGSYILRILVLIFGVWLFNHPILGPSSKYFGAGYLTFLVFDYFRNQDNEDGEEIKEYSDFVQTVIRIAFADLAFSLDSGTTALALSDNIYIILSACGIGVLGLRLLAGWFIGLLDKFANLESAGYVAIQIIAIQLVVNTFNNIEIPELYNIGVIILVFLWGFSKRNITSTI